MTEIRLSTGDGRPVSFVDEMIGQGGMKDVYMSPGRDYVVAFFRDKLDQVARERLRSIVTTYREGIFERAGGDYWKDLFCWPSGIVDHDGRTGVVVPVYPPHFFFEHGSVNGDVLGIRGREKEGKWFASASNRSRFLDPREKGDWLSHLRICLLISRAVRRLHAAGLAHSDLSYKNVLVDPAGGHACIIDIDGLVVPGKFPPDVVGTPDFIAPEVVATQHLDRHDPARKLPSTLTDRHALAVLVYMYLLYRHPLRGSRVNDIDAARDEELSMGRQALFVEHPGDQGNRIRVDQVRASELPWADTQKLPFTMAGPLLAELFEKAFVDGLHDPRHRPTAQEWESALVRTVDLIQPCANPACEMRWYVFANTTRPACPFCGTRHVGKLPVLNLYSSRHSNRFQPDNHRLMVWNGQSLHVWHANRRLFPNEHLEPEQRSRVGYFQQHQGEWYLVNERLPRMHDVGTGKDVPIGSHVRLADRGQILLSREDGGRLVQVQMIEA